MGFGRKCLINLLFAAVHDGELLVLLCVSSSLQAEVDCLMEVSWLRGRGLDATPFMTYCYLIYTEARRDLMESSSINAIFFTIIWPLLFGRLSASEEIYHLVSFEPCQRLCFKAGCGGQGPPSKCWDAIIKLWAEDSHPATFCPQTHDIFPLFSQFFWHLAFFISASSSPYFSESFSYNAAKTVWPLSSSEQKIATAAQLVIRQNISALE